MIEISRKAYCDMYGPTVGDRVRLGDTSLIAEVEKDLTVHGDEAKFGGGKSLRDGMGQSCKATDKECLDTVITNALIIDSTGIIKADVGIKDGRIAGIGKAGNPDIMNGPRQHRQPQGTQALYTAPATLSSFCAFLCSCSEQNHSYQKNLLS